MALKREIDQLRAAEERVLDKIRRHERVAVDVHQAHREQMTFGQRMADGLARFAGSWTFILVLLGFIVVWVAFNAVEVIVKPWDPYPFILLNLFLSFLAGLQAPVIMMSQNRQEARDRLRSEADYEINLKAELEIENLHTKMDELRERQWRELLEIQQQQIDLLREQIQLLRGTVSEERPATGRSGPSG